MIKTSIKILISAILFCLICYVGITIAHMVVFSRADYDKYDSNKFLLYDDLDAKMYPRDEISIPSGDEILTAYLYGKENTQGLIIVSPGHRDPNDIKLYEIIDFVDNGWMVLCFDYTGCYNSTGSNMIGYTQAVYGLNAVLQFVENDSRMAEMPIMLFGHSLGGYASAAVLSYGYNIRAAVIASAFDTPKEQWLYSIKRFTGYFHIPLLPFTNLFIELKYGNEANLSAIAGINATDIPILVISGTDDEYYGGESPVHKKREDIKNPNCTFWLMEEPGASGHYDYFLTEAAKDYQRLIASNKNNDVIDKKRYMEHDEILMNSINDFFLSALSAH